MLLRLVSVTVTEVADVTEVTKVTEAEVDIVEVSKDRALNVMGTVADATTTVAAGDTFPITNNLSIIFLIGPRSP